MPTKAIDNLGAEASSPICNILCTSEICQPAICEKAGCPCSPSPNPTPPSPNPTPPHDASGGSYVQHLLLVQDQHLL